MLYEVVIALTQLLVFTVGLCSPQRAALSRGVAQRTSPRSSEHWSPLLPLHTFPKHNIKGCTHQSQATRGVGTQGMSLSLASVLWRTRKESPVGARLPILLTGAALKLSFALHFSLQLPSV